MKKYLSLALAVVLTLLLFASCGNGGSTPVETATPTAQATPDATDEPAPVESAQPESPYPFAVDENGIATEPYDYELPLTTGDEVLTYWFTVWTPQYLPTEDFGDTALPEEAKARTGVNVEYVMVPNASRKEAFSVLLASDDLCDIMCNANSYYPGTPLEMVDDGFFVNVYDHREYMPNYLYQAKYKNPNDTATYETVFYYKDFVPTVFGMNVKSGEMIGGYCIRQDWLDLVGLKAEDIVTWDDLENALKSVKSAVDTCEYPLWLSQTLEMNKYWQFQSYGSLACITTTALPSMFIQDGKVEFGCTTESDRELMTKLNSFYNEGLINPDWTGYAIPADFTDHTYNNEIAYQYHGATGLSDAIKQSSDPDVNWAPVQKPLLSEGQILKVGSSTSRCSTGCCSFSAKSENLELAMKWIDYRYSPSGWELYAYGPEGVVVSTDENGERHNTEFALNNPDGFELTWLMFIYSLDAFVDPGITTTENKLLNENGDLARDAIAIWTNWLSDNYDASGLYPVGARLTTEQSTAVTELRADIITYIAENFSGFLDGSKSLDDWDEYVNALNELGMQQIRDIYQAAYESYLTTK